MSHSETRFLIALGMPAFALSLGITTLAALLPLVLLERTGPVAAGAVVALEGAFALVVPPIVGPWSDRRGSRLPFVAGAGAVGAAALVLVAFSEPIPLVVLGVSLFVVAYYAYLTPYLALYPQLVGAGERGRSLGSQGAWREAGLGGGLVLGPVLIGIWQPAPFLLAAAVLLVVTPWFGAIVARREREAAADGGEPEGGAPGGWRRLPLLVREHAAIRWFAVANALWETALAALRAFAVLFFTVGLGRSEAFASLVLGIVAVAALVAAPASGWLADRLGRRRVVRVALWAYAIAVLAPALSQELWVVAVVPLGAVAAVTLMTLPFALLMDLLPPRDHGSAAAVFGVSRGVGLMLGPLAAGVAIASLDGVFEATDGYASLFAVASLALLASVPALRRAS